MYHISEASNLKAHDIVARGKSQNFGLFDFQIQKNPKAKEANKSKLKNFWMDVLKQGSKQDAIS